MGEDLSGGLFAAVCPGYDVETTFSLTFLLDSLSEKPTTEKILVGNHLEWYFRADKAVNGGEEFLRTTVFTEDWYKYPMSYDVEYTLEAKDPKDRIAKKLSFNYDGSDNTMNGWSIISCDKLLMERDKFEVYEKLTMTAKLNVSMPVCFNFKGADWLSDITIKIEVNSFPFNKTFLALHSTYFRAMFFGQFAEAKQDEVTLPDVDMVAFVNLINALFVRSFELKMSAVASVLQLADRFGIFSILNHCEELLTDPSLETQISLAERFSHATKYSLDKLLKRCLLLCKSTDLIKEVTKSPFYKDISADGKVMLLDRMVEVLSILTVATEAVTPSRCCPRCRSSSFGTYCKTCGDACDY